MIQRLTWICAVLAIVGLAIANVVDLARTHPLAPIELSGAPTDPVMRAESRFAAVRAALRQRGVTGHVGYYADVPAERFGATPGAIERYFSAQFALAPLILDGDGRDEWLITDFEQQRNSATRLPQGWTEAADGGGSGVKLFHRHP